MGAGQYADYAIGPDWTGIAFGKASLYIGRDGVNLGAAYKIGARSSTRTYRQRPAAPLGIIRCESRRI